MNKTKHKQINPVSKHPVDNYLESYGNLGISCHSISVDYHSFDFFQEIHCMTKAESVINTSCPNNCCAAPDGECPDVVTQMSRPQLRPSSAQQLELQTKVPKDFTITEKAPTSAFTFKNLLRRNACKSLRILAN